MRERKQIDINLYHGDFDVQYSPVSKTCTMDIFLPEGKGPFPVIVSIHGGAFKKCDKRDEEMIVDMLHGLDKGYAVIGVNYRLSGEAVSYTHLDVYKRQLLSIPTLAWARCHHKQPNEYPYLTKYCYETMSNKEGWKEVSEDDIDTYLSSLTDQPLDIEVAKCSCGHHEFQVKINQQNQVIQLICIHCGDRCV